MRIRTQVWAPVASAVTVVTVVGAGVLLTSGGSGPRPLRLASADADRALAAAAPTAGSGSYVLAGTLPAGTPSPALAWDLSAGPAPAAVVARLAGALHAGSPLRAGRGWRAGGLTVSGKAGQAWTFSPCPSVAVASSDAAGGTPGVAAGCAVSGPASVSGSSGGGAPVPPDAVVTPQPPVKRVPPRATQLAPPPGSATLVPLPPDASPVPPVPPIGKPPAPPAPSPPPAVPASSLLTGAAPVLAALGIDPADATVDAGPYGGSVTVDPHVAGVRVSGLTTRLEVDRTGTVAFGTGWLGTVSPADRYPLVSARTAFDALVAPPRMLLMCPVSPTGKGCATPPPAVITGAELGLSVQPLAGGGQVLVPSWLFTLRGTSQPVVGVAVQRRYLVAPAPGVPAGPGGAPSLPSGVPSVAGGKGAPGPGEPMTFPPGGPDSGAAQPGSPGGPQATLITPIPAGS